MNADDPPQMKITAKSKQGQLNLVLVLLRPYRKWLLLVFLALVIETVMGLLAPWPLKIIIDNVIGHHPLPAAFGWLNGSFITQDYKIMAAAAAISIVVFAILGSLASYINSYYTNAICLRRPSNVNSRMSLPSMAI